VVPTSIFRALADGEILQIVVFSLFAGVALVALGERGRPLLEFADNVSHMMLVITGYVIEARADRGVRLGRRGHHPVGAGHPAELREIPRRLLSHPHDPVGHSHPGRVFHARSAHGSSW